MSVIPMDQVAAVESEQRAKAEAKRAAMYNLKVQVDAKKRDLKRHQQKLREITECNATMLSANGDLLIRQAIHKIEREIQALEAKREEASKG